jgi:hypothetical protein
MLPLAAAVGKQPAFFGLGALWLAIGASFLKKQSDTSFPSMKALNLLVAVPTLALCVSAFAQTAPSEFVTQVLEPTGGKIERPKEWFYAEGHHGPMFMWTISREDTTGNRAYTTGVRIQAFMGVKEGTGKTAKEFVLEFANAKKKEVKILRSCPEVDQGLFTRMCLETEEGPHRILYSLFWGNGGMDLAMISIAGTTRENWKTYSSTFDRMSTFELIDMKRFPE